MDPKVEDDSRRVTPPDIEPVETRGDALQAWRRVIENDIATHRTNSLEHPRIQSHLGRLRIAADTGDTGNFQTQHVHSEG